MSRSAAPSGAKLALGVGLLTAGLVALLVAEALLAARGKREPFVNPSRVPRELGSGASELTYAVVGDSTAAGQGARYERGIAVATARHLAASGRRVSLVNTSVSGAKTGEVAAEQLPLAVRLRPHVALVAVGANDVIRLSGRGQVREAIETIVDGLVASRCDVKIVLTGAPEMGAIPRFAQPLRWVAGRRTQQLNGVFEQLVRERGLTLAPIAAETGALFRRDRTLFASDRFHPNERGYATWVPLLTRALDRALAAQPSHCP